MSSHKDGNILDTFFGFLGLASELAWPVLTVVFLVLAHRISQDKDMNVQTVLRPAMSKLKTIIGQRFILFFFATLFTVVEQICHVFAPVKTNANDLIWGFLTELGIDPLRILIGLASMAGWIICQYIIFLDNMLDDQSVDEAHKHGKMRFLLFVVANMASAMAIVLGSFLLLVPGLFLYTILWIAPAISICERRGITAIGRCFILADKEFWSVAKVVLPFSLAMSVTAAVPDIMALVINSKILLASTTAVCNILVFAITVLSWQCQYDLYKYLVKSNYGVQDDPTAKTSEPQT
ncbi:MAG: hypothetical protein KA392_04680 [Candidatus Obscuribacter sp.]|nr:hypothetical protein [Candidatus Obscuribacter sp.]MBP6592646.1 hypothetical protein [Candidatus Obscuribacter sp.]MBP7576539.1 hypothetical protein [Candidatus Obscuribacter sp.]